MRSYAEWEQLSRDFHARVQVEVPEHANAWRLFENLTDQPFPYHPTHAVPEDGITAFYRSLQNAKGGMHNLPFLIDIGVEGFLHKAEALKLYEMAFYARGDVLELGTHKGLSTSIMAQALHDKGGGRLETSDIDEATNPIAKANLADKPGNDRVTFHLVDAAETMDRLIAEGRQFGFIFIDHWHGYEATFEAARRVPACLKPGGHVMFHDFFDPANSDPEHVYGVYQAFLDTLGQDKTFVYAGAAGSSAIFAKTGTA
jgi:predicted O-methyltransferase YrrM